MVTDQDLQADVDAATAAITTAQASLIEMSVMAGTATITGTAKFGQTLTADISALTYTPATGADVPAYQWARDGVNIGGATSDTYILVLEDIGTAITVTVTADGDNATGSVTSAATAVVVKADGPSAPAAPAMASKTATEVTLTANALHEFSIDNGSTWQISNTFTGLDPNTAYDLVARIKATSTHEASAASAATTITTDAALVTGITVTGIDNIDTVVNGDTLQMIATIDPVYATDDSVTWSIVAGSGTIDGTGLLTGTSVGTVTVKATANDGSGVIGQTVIAVATSYAVGDVGQSGGIVFYDKGNYSDGWQYLEIATLAQGDGADWTWFDTEWSNVGTTLAGTDIAIGTGQANTDAMMAQAGHWTSAAKLCADWNYFNVDQFLNYDDWFLPSKDELTLIYQNLYQGAYSTEFVAESFYWSSSEVNATDAYGLTFLNAYNFYWKTYTSGYVRPVRSF